MNKIKLLIELGLRLGGLLEEERAVVARARVENPWFTDRWIGEAAKHWSEMLTSENIQSWLNPYVLKETNKTVGIIMAGNIPLVGLHDLLSVVVCGAKAKCKLSSSDKVLMEWVINTLFKIDPSLKGKIEIVENRLTDMDGLIATGSDNSSRYFEYYFKDIPKIIRKNRSSVAVIDEDVTTEQLELLSHDIFSYFGLGCRNVGKVYLPEGFDVTKMIDAFEGFMDHKHHHKYANNYTYHKAILLMNLDKHLDNGFLILQEKNAEIKPPLGVLFYGFYKDKKALVSELANSNKIQCMVGHGDAMTPFGSSQKPKLNDYADHIDTIAYINNL